MKDAINGLKQYANILGAMRKYLVEAGFSEDHAAAIVLHFVQSNDQTEAKEATHEQA